MKISFVLVSIFLLGCSARVSLSDQQLLVVEPFRDAEIIDRARVCTEKDLIEYEVVEENMKFQDCYFFALKWKDGNGGSSFLVLVQNNQFIQSPKINQWIILR